MAPVNVGETVTKTIVMLEGEVSEACPVVETEVLFAAFCGKATTLAELTGGKGAVTLTIVSTMDTMVVPRSMVVTPGCVIAIEAAFDMNGEAVSTGDAGMGTMILSVCGRGEVDGCIDVDADDTALGDEVTSVDVELEDGSTTTAVKLDELAC